jgi:transposase
MVLGIDHDMAEAVGQRDEVAFGIDDGLLHPGRALFQQPAQQMRFAGAGIALHQQARRQQLLEIEPIRGLYPWLRHVFADGGYAGDKLRDALAKLGDWTIEIIKRSDTAKGFVLLPKRWVVERSFAWLNRNRRLAKDVEATIKSAAAFLFAASVMLMTRRIARLLP